MTRSIATFYRLLYDGVLSRLPEPAAIALGQTGLKLLPLDRLSAFRLEDPRLAVTVGSVRLPNPLILAAMYADRRILARAMGLGFGAVTTKSITRQPRPGHPQPNLVRVRTADGPGLVNCNGFENPGVEAFAAALRGLPRRVPLIVSVAGESADDYLDLARALAPFADLLELNISSPNTALVYAWSTRPRELRDLLERVRAAVAVPIIVKLSPDFAETNERDIIPAALEAGVRVVNYGNTRRVGEPRLSQKTGGLSGPAIFPATLENVRRTRAVFGDALDLIATGGVDAPDKARRLLDAGATAVGYFTGFITRGPILARLILESLRAAR
ncbi:MAG: dihydroorotate dehydrogenase [Candidatus Rokuibacteriota bacterium]